MNDEKIIHVVFARFDDETDNKLTDLKNKFAEYQSNKAVTDFPPHITIAAYENIDIDKLCSWTAEFSKNHKEFKIAIPSLGIFPPKGE